MSTSSISSIANLQLWLDCADINSFVSFPYSPSQPLYDVIQWRDKSSNAYTFIPMIMENRPILSTNALKFNIASSFQMISQQKIPANSTLDLYMIITPELLRGPRQPFFDSTDFTLCETDTRLNTHIYADGGEFFRPIPTPGYTQGFQVYKGDLYAATNVSQVPNYIQRYDKLQRNFTYVFQWPMSTANTRGMAVLDGKLFTASGSRCEWYNGSTAFVSTNFISTGTTGSVCPIVYKGDFYMACGGSVQSSSNATTRPQLFRYDSNTNNFTAIALLNTYLDGGNRNQNYSNAINYKNDMYFGASDDFGFGTPRWNGFFLMSNGIFLAPNHINVYMGSILATRNENRFFKWNNNLIYNIGRQNVFTNSMNGGIAYKGNLILYKNMNFNNSNIMEIYSGEQGGPFSNALTTFFTTNATPLNQSPGAIIHEGRLFINWNSSSQVIEYGNGIGLDQSFSNFTGAPLLVALRKSPLYTQLMINGRVVQEDCVNFTYSNQTPREMHIGGAVGSLAHGFSDSGHDHFTGSIHTVVQYTSNLSQSDRQRVEGILTWNYGIQSILPLDHPFRNAAP
jgi:hypothetical protein